MSVDIYIQVVPYNVSKIGKSETNISFNAAYIIIYSNGDSLFFMFSIVYMFLIILCAKFTVLTLHCVKF